MSHYQRRTYLVDAADEETFAAELFALGALGCEIKDDAPGRRRLEVYFPDPPPPGLDGWDLGPWPARGVVPGPVESFAERDWLAEYRAQALPIAVGERFLVDPRDPDDDTPPPVADDRIVLRVPARTAFGTGSHESTRLVVRWLEELLPRGLDVLDVGCGSGILAFAALSLGARRVVGFDVDPAAALVARANALLNGLEPRLFAGRLAALVSAPAFDLALVNVLPERILGEVEHLRALLRPGGRMVSSGNLVERRDELRRRFAACGFEAVGEKRDGEWLAFLLEVRG